jgi:protein TonB
VLPERSLTVPPTYPEAARDAGIQGTVKVRAHVRADGTVDAIAVVHSIPGLDEAAMQCVKQWRFKPASFQGKPVAVWVGVPVRFTLH